MFFEPKDISTEILKLCPNRQPDWEDHLAWWNGGNLIFNDTDQLVEFVLDEIIYQSPLAKLIAMKLEDLYERGSEETRKVMIVGMFEEFCDRLHYIWDKDGLYKEKRQLLLQTLGPYAKEHFLAFEAGKHNKSQERTE